MNLWDFKCQKVKNLYLLPYSMTNWVSLFRLNLNHWVQLWKISFGLNVVCMKKKKKRNSLCFTWEAFQTCFYSLQPAGGTKQEDLRTLQDTHTKRKNQIKSKLIQTNYTMSPIMQLVKSPQLKMKYQFALILNTN